MRDGAIHCAGRPEDVLTAETLSTVYGVAVSVERTESGRLTCVPPLRAARPQTFEVHGMDSL